MVAQDCLQSASAQPVLEEPTRAESPAEPVPGGESNLCGLEGFAGGDAVLNGSFLASVDLWFLQNLGPISHGLKKRKTGGQQSGLLITLFCFLHTCPTAALVPEGAVWDLVGLSWRSSPVEERLAQR